MSLLMCHFMLSMDNLDISHSLTNPELFTQFYISTQMILLTISPDFVVQLVRKLIHVKSKPTQIL